RACTRTRAERGRNKETTPRRTPPARGPARGRRNVSEATPDEKLLEILAGVVATSLDLGDREVAEHTRSVLNVVLVELTRHLAFSGEEVITQFLRKADEVTATKLLLEPLFGHLGYEAVRVDDHRDRRLEFGQDIREMRL